MRVILNKYSNPTVTTTLITVRYSNILIYRVTVCMSITADLVCHIQRKCAICWFRLYGRSWLAFKRYSFFILIFYHAKKVKKKNQHNRTKWFCININRSVHYKYNYTVSNTSFTYLQYRYLPIYVLNLILSTRYSEH